MIYDGDSLKWFKAFAKHLRYTFFASLQQLIEENISTSVVTKYFTRFKSLSTLLSTIITD